MKVRAFTTVLVMALLAAASAAQLPPISWTCPMHPDVLEDKKGACSICGMDLEPVRLVSMWTCPLHAVIEESKPGRCRICRRELVQMMAALTWTCAGNREVNQIEPGKCTDGSAMVARYTQRPHGDHNPKHGGVFFMAPDNWHHIEGTYPAAGRFRVYVYDDYSRPLGTAAARKVRGRVVTKEMFDANTGTTRELASTPLVLARNGTFFEARIEPIPLPAQMIGKISFKSDDKESRFDFTFPSFSKDVPSTAAPAPATSGASGFPPSREALRRGLAVASAEADSRTETSPASAAEARLKADATAGALLSDLKARQAEVESLVKSGSFAGIYLPALQAKDLALEIQTRQRAGIDPEALEIQVKQLVVAAYQLDSYGDIGDGPRIDEAYRSFSRAISGLELLIAGRR
jgi:heavy metal-binding protein